MDVLKELVRGCLLYDFQKKVGLSTAASSHRICQAFGDSAVNERTAVFLKLSNRPTQALGDEALQAAIEEDSSQTCGEFTRQFNTFSQTVRLHLYRLDKTYRLSKRAPRTLLEVHKQQRVADCLSLLSRHGSASIFNRVLISDEKWVLYDTPI
ncbi:histone-lysine N-methyltransferase SETMAR [Trichonephila clavipes]|nr:histone-lysine N-methyltransferase SETMAR [Trichonephila clavipes]